jgi:hypothetical protein
MAILGAADQVLLLLLDANFLTVVLAAFNP